MDRRKFVISVPLFLAACAGGTKSIPPSAGGGSSAGSGGGGGGSKSGGGGSGGGGGGSGTAGPGYDGIIAVNSSGKLVNGAGNAVNLRGLGLYGLESQTIQGYHTNDEWGSEGNIGTAPAGPVWPLMATWKANSVRIAMNAQVFLGVNFGVLSSSGSAASPAWAGTTATASSTGTTISVASTTDFVANSAGGGPCYLVNLSSGSVVPAGTQILTASGNTITVNKACTINSGDVITMVKAADTAGGIREAVQTAISFCRQFGLYIIWDLHWTAPELTFPVVGTSKTMTAYCGANGQPPFVDASAGKLFWTDATQSLPAWLLANYGPHSSNYNAKYGPTGIGDMIFELFNEPYPNDLGGQGAKYTALTGGASITSYEAMMNGGNCNMYLLQYAGVSHGAGIPSGGKYGGLLGPSSSYPVMYELLGYQAAVNGIRALGCSNICLCNPGSWATALDAATNLGVATDPAPAGYSGTWNPQIGWGWHPYEGSTTAGQPGGGNVMLTRATAIMNGTTFGRPIPFVITEFGDAKSPTSGPAAPTTDAYVQMMQNFVDTTNGMLGAGTLGCHCFQWTGPLHDGSNGKFDELTASPAADNVSITAQVSGTTMTVTATSGTIQVGLSCLQDVQGTFVVSQTSGTPGGAGVYQISNAMSSGTFNWTMLIPSQGQGKTVYDWMVNHA